MFLFLYFLYNMSVHTLHSFVCSAVSEYVLTVLKFLAEEKKINKIKNGDIGKNAVLVFVLKVRICMLVFLKMSLRSVLLLMQKH